MQHPTLFGSPAKLNLVSPDKLTDEDDLCDELRTLVGPYASEERLRHHLRATRGKVHWAVNGYFREALITSVEHSRTPDFEYKRETTSTSPLTIHEGADKRQKQPAGTKSFATRTQSGLSGMSSQREVSATNKPAGAASTLLDLPQSLLEEVLKHADSRTVSSAAQASRALCQASLSDSVWRRLCHQRWPYSEPNAEARLHDCASSSKEPAVGTRNAAAEAAAGRNSIPSESSMPSNSGSAALEGGWRTAYIKRHRDEINIICPKCGKQRLVPVVYGFPHPALVAMMATGRVVLGSDHLIVNEPIWSCFGCETKFTCYPYHPWPSGDGQGTETARESI